MYLPVASHRYVFWTGALDEDAGADAEDGVDDFDALAAGAADGMATDAGADLGFDLVDDVSEPPSKKQRAESVEVAADDGSDFGL